jgi:hypothetical protein
MLIEMMTLAAILLLLNRRRAEAGGCAVYGQPGFYFTWEEMTATRLPFANNPSGPQCTNLKRLASNILDPLREITGAPLYVTSGFRSELVNRSIPGSVKNSLHLQGKAADFYSNKYNPSELKALVIQYGIPHGELIVYPDHLHVSL